jgi:hypothetical protein
VMSIGLFNVVQGQPGSGEAAFDEAGLVLDLLQAVPDGLDQVGEAGGGEVGEHAALEHRPDPGLLAAKAAGVCASADAIPAGGAVGRRGDS